MAYRPQVLAPTDGGTGCATLTNHGVLVGAGTSGITQLAVGTNGQVLIGSSGADPAFATLTSTAGSITFTTGANSLNLDVTGYATGTFTPTITNSGSAPTLTYTSQQGYYTVIGNRFFIDIALTLNTYTAGTGNAQISSLPFTSNANLSCYGVQDLGTTTFGASVSYYIFKIATSVTTGTPQGIRSGSSALPLAASGLAAGARTDLTFVYQ